MKHLRDLDVLVLGLGHSGLAMARWCARHGARVRVWDSREQPPQLQALHEAVPAAVFERELTLGAARLVLKSPGIAPDDAQAGPLLQAAREVGLAVQGELDLFAQALADLQAEHGYAPQVLAITGTNGKTTTTALTALLVQRCGRRVASAGNIGPTMLDTLAAALDAETWPGAEAPVGGETHDAAAGDLTPDSTPAEGLDEAAADVAAGDELDVDAEAGSEDGVEDRDAAEDGDEAAVTDEPHETDEPDDSPVAVAAPRPPRPATPAFSHLPEVWVLELSSFQLDGVRAFEPSAATVLNVTQDHLDWHGSLQAYAAAKARVFGERAVMVINRDDAAVEAMVPAPVVVKGAGKGSRPRTVERSVLRFGLGAPSRPGDFGLVTENGMAWLVRAQPADETVARRRRSAAAEPEELHLQRLMPADALRLRGRHNAANALAALALATAIGCPLAPMLHGLREYRGEPHRVQFVARLGEVEAFDDSKGTNVGATVAALLGLGADKAPGRLVVILGGDGKGQDFAPLAAPVARHARAVATLGRDAGAIEQALAGSGVPLQRHDTLEAATAWCFAQARPGDAVLLSPACASLDMFRNYGHRAEVFVAAVRELAAERGEAL